MALQNIPQGVRPVNSVTNQQAPLQKPSSLASRINGLIASPVMGGAMGSAAKTLGNKFSRRQILK